MHCPRRMVGGNVERFEIVEVVLDLGPFHDIESEMAKERLNSLQRSGDRMKPPGPLAAPGEGDVDASLFQFRIHGSLGQRFPA